MSNYLRRVKMPRELGFDIMYLDKTTWKNQFHTANYTGMESCKLTPTIPSEKGQRFIILHSGGADIGPMRLILCSGQYFAMLLTLV